ncbi:glycosyltransferase family 4 protein [Chryseobacterium sp.]|uniref:glycosyltransferase family 4 protein n=1 Tax=Chryseobacterium sp. TaxID=1871047 RepID=UPI002897C926|nr:glycosyltransferase family 4 protein [Chryseobacterium sp.]
MFHKFTTLLRFALFIITFLLRSLKCKTIFFFPFYHTGGGERVHLDIVKALGKKKSIVFITDFSYNDHYKKEFQENSYVYDCKPYLKNKYYKQIIFFSFRQMGRFQKKSTLGCNSAFYYKILPYFDEKVKKTDLIHAFSYPENGAEIVSLPYIKYLDKRVVINKKTKHDFAELYTKEKIDLKFLERIEIIGNATHVPSTLPQKDRYHKKLNVVYVGRIAHEKRVNLIIEIGEKLADKMNLEIFGPKEITPQGLEKFYKGNLTLKSNLLEAYKNADIILISSYREGFPVVLMEGMAHAVVPISTDVGGIGEHIQSGKNGFLIDSNQSNNDIVDDFVEKILLLDSDRKLLQTVAENAYQYAKSNFGYDVFDKKYRKLLLN